MSALVKLFSIYFFAYVIIVSCYIIMIIQLEG